MFIRISPPKPSNWLLSSWAPHQTLFLRISKFHTMCLKRLAQVKGSELTWKQLAFKLSCVSFYGCVWFWGFPWRGWFSVRAVSCHRVSAALHLPWTWLGCTDLRWIWADRLLPCYENAQSTGRKKTRINKNKMNSLVVTCHMKGSLQTGEKLNCFGKTFIESLHRLVGAFSTCEIIS